MSDRTLTGTVDMMEWQMDELIGFADHSPDVSFIAGHTRPLEQRPVVLMKALEQALEASRPIIDAHGHTLAVNCNDYALAVEGDPAHLARILTNLLSDCAKCIESGGTLSLAVERERGDAIISVSDSGVGISPEYLEDVFDVSSHFKVQQARCEGALAIDLAPVRELAQMHGGSVSAYSRGIGAGSTLTVRLPALARTYGPMRGRDSRNSRASDACPTSPHYVNSPYTRPTRTDCNE